jgi:hypothetical protein
MNDHVAADSMSWRRHPLCRRILQVTAVLMNTSAPMDLSAWDRLLSDDTHVHIAHRRMAVEHAIDIRCGG